MSPDPEYTLVENKEDEDGGPLKQRGCTDIICLLIFVVFLAGMVRHFPSFSYFDCNFTWLSTRFPLPHRIPVTCSFLKTIIPQGVLTWYAFSWGDPYRITNGYDSFGNVCGRNNAATKNENVTQSGRDMTDKP